LPDEIGNCESLKEFYLNKNKLKSLPTSVRNLSKISTLDLRKNEFHDDLPQNKRNFFYNIIMSLWAWYSGYEILDTGIDEETLGKAELQELFTYRIRF